ncbi:MAG TPA: hypothetical protein DCX28_04115, partial [Enterobacteriaceae bacterium]|nr:hypothetical protein [Enterobacteriaceae bacterium]
VPGWLAAATLATRAPGRENRRCAGVESPLKPAKRRPDDKDWTPGMAARGETRRDVESSRPSVSWAGGERSAQHRFPRGAAGIDKGAAVAPLSRSRVMHAICSAGMR